ncbi:MAG: PIN domain-containing protein, partial [Actinomycetota bacterium]|nr:PIN domain-containing protein [Actinomycetota bacterium]
GAPTRVWHSYLRLVTNPKVASPSASIAAAFAFIASIRAQPGCQEIEPGRRHLAVLERVCVAADVRADLVNDASLAAIAIEHGATVASFDRDFARFPGLRWIVPGD